MKTLSFPVLSIVCAMACLLAIQGCEKKLKVNPQPEIIHVQGVTVTASSTELTVDEESKLTVNVTPSTATDKGVKYTSDKPLVVEVDQQGNIKALSPGTATITVTSNDGGKTATVQITVKEKTVSVTGVEIQDSQTVHNMVVGDPMFLRVIVSPQDAANQNFTAESSDSEVLTIDRIEKKDGYYAVYLNGIKGGNATVTVTTEDGGHTASAEVKVIDFIEITSMTVSPSSLNMEVGDLATLTAIIEPENATARYVTWTSSDGAVAAIQSIGYLTANIVANGPGTATITATSVDNSTTATCEITVTEKGIAVTGVEIQDSQTVHNMVVGDPMFLRVIVSPQDAANQNFTAESSDSEVLTIDRIEKKDGYYAVYLNGIKGGNATVTVTTEDGGHTASAEVKVIDFIEITSMTVSPSSLNMEVGDLATLTAIIEPDNATAKYVSWKSSDGAVAAIQSIGYLTANIVANGPGTATITATSVDNSTTATCVVTVVDNKVSVTGIEFTNGTSFSVPEGKTTRLLVRVLPEDATNKDFTIHIADPSILEVDQILNDKEIYLRGLKEGKTNVTVTTEDGGHTATTEVTVTEFITLTSLSFDKENVTIKVGEYTDLTIIKEPANATDPGSILFNSDDRDVVVPGMVGSKLRLWAQEPGTATVTLSYAGSDVPPATCVVTVVENQ